MNTETLCHNTMTDLFRFSPRDLARIERPFTHECVASYGDDMIRGLITMTFDGVYYSSPIAVPRSAAVMAPDARTAYSEAIMSALYDIYFRLPLLDRPWHWHERA